MRTVTLFLLSSVAAQLVDLTHADDETTLY